MLMMFDGLINQIKTDEIEANIEREQNQEYDDHSDSESSDEDFSVIF